MIPEIWSAMDRIFCHFGPFLALLPSTNPKNQKFEKLKKMPEDIIKLHVYHKWQSDDVWFLKYWVWKTDFFVILDHFFPSYPPNNQKNQNFEKMKILPGDIIILHMCTINDNHMMHGSWDNERNRKIFFVILNHFLPFYPLTTQKIKILKNWKTDLKILSFYTCVP